MSKKMTYAEAGKLGAIAAQKTIQEQVQKRTEKYNQNPKLCKNCQKPLPYNKKKNTFCSKSCAAIYNNQDIDRCKNRGGSGKYAKKDCLQCNEETTNPKYCCHKCFVEHHWEQREKEAEAKGHLNDYGPHARKDYLLKIRPNKCAICSIKEWNGQPILLIMDHINGNAQNNNLDNLRLICSNCDTQLDTYKGKNVGNGRHSRRERYTQGKSY